MKVQLKEYEVEMKDEVGWGDDAIIKAEMMSAMRVSAEQRQQINEAAATADAKGVPAGQDPFKLSGLSMDGNAILAARIKAAELIVTRITPHNVGEGEPDTIPFSRAWLHGLSKTDGNKVMNHVDELRRQVDEEEAANEAIVGK